MFRNFFNSLWTDLTNALSSIRSSFTGLTWRRTAIVFLIILGVMVTSTAFYFGDWLLGTIAVGLNIAAFALWYLATRYRGPQRRRAAKPSGKKKSAGRWEKLGESLRSFLHTLRTAPLGRIALSTLGWIVGSYILTILFPAFWIPAQQVTAAIFTFLFAFPPIPGMVDSLIQRPNRYRPAPAEVGKLNDGEITTRDYPPSRMGFFVYPSPGREYRIELGIGGRAVRGLMATDHRMHLGEKDNPLTPRHAEYWENIPTPSAYEDSHPIPVPWKKRSWYWHLYSPISILWWMWKRYVYWITGAAFTGFYPFQMPRVVPMERSVMRVTDGVTHLDRIEDYSNHYRVEQFMFPLEIADVDTQDKIAFKMKFNVIARTFNSYLTAYRGDDRWSSRLRTSITDPITAYARATPLGMLWVADNELAARALAERVLEIGKRVRGRKNLDPRSPCNYGITIDSVEIVDISPMNPKDAEALGEQARARVKAAAMKLLAEGNAAGVSETIKALAGGEAILRDNPGALAIARMNADVQMAEKAATNGNVVIMGSGGSNNDPMQAALLRELRRLTQGSRR